MTSFNGADVKFWVLGSLRTLDRETWPTIGDWVNDHNADAIIPWDPPLSVVCPSCGGVVGRTVDWFKFEAYCSIRDG